MKHIAIFGTLTAMLLSLFACNPFDRHGRSLMNISFPGKEQRVIVRSDNMSLDITYSGSIVFNDDETAIERITPGGYLDYKLNGKRLLAEPSSTGGVVYRFYDDDDFKVAEGNGKKFLEQAIHEMIAQGMFIEGRMDRLYEDGGIPLLLAEAKKTKSDNVKRRYFEYVLQRDSVLQDDILVMSNLVNKTMGSDNDKKNILEKIPAHFLQDSLTAEAYFAATGSINSDNDKTDVLKKSLREPLSPTAFKLLLNSAVSINSDNDKANLMREVIHHGVLPGENYDSVLGVISTINSDNDKSNVLKTLIDRQVYPGAPFSKLLTVTSKINSDNDKANVFRKLAEKSITEDTDWINLIGEITTISSDNDKANVLLSISKNMPRNDQVIAAYMKSSKSINSDHDYQRVVKSVQ